MPRTAPLALLLTMLCACLPEGGADDDDASGDDDDGSRDDDDATGQTIHPELAGTVSAAVLRAAELRQAVSSDGLGRSAGDAACPAVEVVDNRTTWTGGCDADTGYRFEGSLELVETDTSTDPPQYHRVFTATGWRVEGDGSAFSLIALDGAATETRSVEGDDASESVVLDGAVEYDRGLLATTSFAPAVRGSYVFTRLVTPTIVGRHRYEAAFDDSRGEPWTIDALLDDAAGSCFEFTASSEATVTIRGYIAVLHIGDDPDPCDACWPWSVDGVPQPAQACLTN